MAVLSFNSPSVRVRPRRRRAAPLWALLLSGGVLALPLPGADQAKQPAASLEYQVKAAFLYNFAKFAEWPADKAGGGPFVVGVLGKDPFGPALDQAFGGKTINGRALQIWRITGVAEARQCQMLFVSSSEAKRLPEILGTLRSASVLTVSEIDRFAERGGMINLRTEDNKVRLEINTDAAAQAGIQISSKLVKLARVVRTEVKTAKD